MKNFKLSVLNINELSSIGENFDIIFNKFVYAFIEDKEKFLIDIKSLMSENSIFVLMTDVLHKDINYLPTDKPKTKVNFEETKKLLNNNFNSVEIFHHNYFNERGDIVTFFIKK